MSSRTWTQEQIIIDDISKEEILSFDWRSPTFNLEMMSSCVSTQEANVLTNCHREQLAGLLGFSRVAILD
jgi:hypothetical protein